MVEEIRIGAWPILRTNLEHFPLERRIPLFEERRWKTFSLLSLPAEISDSEKRGRRDDSIDDKGELFFRPYDRYPRCSFQARVDNKFKFRGACNL